MEPKIIYSSKIPQLLSVFINIGAITIWPFIIYRNSEDEVSPVTVNHEKIHIKQQEELFLLGFYILYVYYWLAQVIKLKGDTKQAYYEIPFEREAYCNDENFEYLSSREKHSWTKYLDSKINS